ncbi:MAG TPA: hypothetical protein VM638_06620 [Actinomycetota bacterium]|nr:hypothetical protein [Actinomycetota bacterium]
MSEYIKGSRPRQLPPASRTYGGGRVCAEQGCETRISIYNKATHCWAHAPLRYPVSRGERRKKTAA